MKIFALSTIDNPWNPITDFEKWFSWDISHGYDTCGLLSRIAHTSDSLTDEENTTELERAIDYIVAIDPFNIYKKVTKRSAEAT